MNSKNPRKKVPVKTIYHHVIRAKLYAILTMNALEGMMLEMNNLITAEMNRSNFDIFTENLRRYQHGFLFPTSHGDFLDRAVKSLAKELEVPVNVELVNAQAVKKVIMSLTRGVNDQERDQLDQWLGESNEFIVKSPRYDQLIESACMYFYKKPASQVSEDTLNFIRRSANELLRNKASKEAMRKRLRSEEGDEEDLDKMIVDNDTVPREYDMEELENVESSDDEYILSRHSLAEATKRDKQYDTSLYADKRQRDATMHM